MTRLFAAHLTQKTTPVSLPPGHYDSEQELWVADNQLQGMHPFRTATAIGTNTKLASITVTTVIVENGTAQIDHHPDTEPDSDTSSDSDNP
jgi:hypothetical protein